MSVHHLPSRPAPELKQTIKAVAEYDTYPEPDEQLSAEAADLLAAAEWVSETHVGNPFEQPNGTFGPCRDCGHPWPCPAWDDIRTLTFSWLCRASIPAIALSRQHNTEFDARRRPA